VRLRARMFFVLADMVVVGSAEGLAKRFQGWRMRRGGGADCLTLRRFCWGLAAAFLCVQGGINFARLERAGAPILLVWSAVFPYILCSCLAFHYAARYDPHDEIVRAGALYECFNRLQWSAPARRIRTLAMLVTAVFLPLTILLFGWLWPTLGFILSYWAALVFGACTPLPRTTP
jgi:hypothetical protein